MSSADQSIIELPGHVGIIKNNGHATDDQSPILLFGEQRFQPRARQAGHHRTDSKLAVATVTQDECPYVLVSAALARLENPTFFAWPDIAHRP